MTKKITYGTIQHFFYFLSVVNVRRIEDRVRRADSDHITDWPPWKEIFVDRLSQRGLCQSGMPIIP